MSAPQTVVIIGGGQAALQLICSLRQGGFGARIILLCDEHSLPYHRPPLSKKFLLGELPREKLLIRKPAYYEEQAVEVRLGVKAVGIDREQHTVTLDTGESLSYHSLVIATGGRARKLDCVPEGMRAVHTVRTSEDAIKLQAAIKNGPRVILVGGGYIGLEVAASLRQKGCEVVILEAQKSLLSRSVTPVMSQAVANIHARHGCLVRCGELLESVEGNGRFQAVVTRGGERIAGDLLVVGVGMLPNSDIAEAAGLACENGVLVDERCRTSDTHIYAIGDVANQFDRRSGRYQRLESVDNATQMAKAAAADIAGVQLSEASAPWFWSDQYDAKLQMVGVHDGESECVVRYAEDKEKLGCFFLDKGKLVAAQFLNAGGDFMAAKALIAANTPVQASQLADPSIRLRDLR